MKQQRLLRNLQEKFIAWAEDQADIQAMLAVGSRARLKPAPDEWSDLDLILFVDKPQAYIDDQTWVHPLGEIGFSFVETHPNGDPELFVVFKEGHKIDVYFDTTAHLKTLTRAQTEQHVVYQRGVRVLLDKTGTAKEIFPTPMDFKPTFSLPDQAAFSDCCHKFWYDVFYTAKQIWRKELWQVKERDHILKQRILTMLEWRTHLQNPTADTWYAGRFMDQWLDPIAWQSIKECFAHFDQDESWKALFATIFFFRGAARETARHLNLEYPVAPDELVSQFVSEMRLDS